MFIVSFLSLGVLGILPANDLRTLLSRIFSVGYFAFFIGLYFVSKYEANNIDATKVVPERVTYP